MAPSITHESLLAHLQGLWSDDLGPPASVRITGKPRGDTSAKGCSALATWAMPDPLPAKPPSALAVSTALWAALEEAGAEKWRLIRCRASWGDGAGEAPSCQWHGPGIPEEPTPEAETPAPAPAPAPAPDLVGVALVQSASKPPTSDSAASEALALLQEARLGGMNALRQLREVNEVCLTTLRSFGGAFKDMSKAYEPLATQLGEARTQANNAREEAFAAREDALSASQETKEALALAEAASEDADMVNALTKALSGVLVERLSESDAVVKHAVKALGRKSPEELRQLIKAPESKGLRETIAAALNIDASMLETL